MPDADEFILFRISVERYGNLGGNSVFFKEGKAGWCPGPGIPELQLGLCGFPARDHLAPARDAIGIHEGGLHKDVIILPELGLGAPGAR